MQARFNSPQAFKMANEMLGKNEEIRSKSKQKPTWFIIFTAEFPSDKASAKKENMGNTYEKGRYLFYLGKE